MSMKKMADDAIDNLNERMENYTGSRQPTDGEVREAAMVCRIQELEEELAGFVNQYGCGCLHPACSRCKDTVSAMKVLMD